MLSSWPWTRTQRTVCLLAAWAQSLFFSVRHVSVFWNMLSVFEGFGVFQTVTVPKEHCACASHMSNLSVCSVQGLRCTRVSSSPVDSAVIGAQRFSCSLVGWQLFPGSSPLYTNLPACDFVYVESRVPCFTGRWTIFPWMSPHFLLKLTVHWLIAGELITV